MLFPKVLKVILFKVSSADANPSERVCKNTSHVSIPSHLRRCVENNIFRFAEKTPKKCLMAGFQPNVKRSPLISITTTPTVVNSRKCVSVSTYNAVCVCVVLSVVLKWRWWRSTDKQTFLCTSLCGFVRELFSHSKYRFSALLNKRLLCF